MSETGQGLIEDNREDEIIPGSEIANVWGVYVSMRSLYAANNEYLSTR
jgi:hypothetical protein